MFLKWPLAKTMAVFMVQGFFASVKFVYAQFPTVNARGDDLFPLLWEAYKAWSTSFRHYM